MKGRKLAYDWNLYAVYMLIIIFVIEFKKIFYRFFDQMGAISCTRLILQIHFEMLSYCYYL